MDVWVIFQSYSWCDVDWHTEWNIYGIYSSEEKAKKVLTSLEAEEKEYCYSLFDSGKADEYDETAYRMEKHSMQ